MPIAPTRGRSGGLSATNAFTPKTATAMPTTPPQCGEEQALGEQLPDEPRSAGAERGPQGELAASLLAAGQQQVRHVHARDYQHQGDRAEHC